MTDHQPSLPGRPDTLLGICQGIGEDTGVNPNLLRVALAVLVLWNPAAMILTYLALGVLLAAIRWLVPVRPAAPAVVALPAARNDAAAPVLAQTA